MIAVHCITHNCDSIVFHHELLFNYIIYKAETETENITKYLVENTAILPIILLPHLQFLIILLSTHSAPSAITCGHPGNPANGRTNGSEFNLNDVVNFTCNRGYIFSGNARAQCRLNGQWSSPLPVCKGHKHSITDLHL